MKQRFLSVLAPILNSSSSTNLEDETATINEVLTALAPLVEERFQGWQFMDCSH